MPVPHICIVTYSGEPLVSDDDRPLVDALVERGCEVSACPWDWGIIECPQPTTFVIRSPWNYDNDPDAFLVWLDGLEKSGHRLLNPFELVRWNIHKRYLFEAASKGVSIPETAIIPRDDTVRSVLAKRFSRHEFLVVKPTISLSAHCTSRIRSSDLSIHASILADSEREYMVQEFVPEIAAGELSFVYFGGQFSHCIRKTPQAGDFRTQGDFGAERERYHPTLMEIEAASKVLTIAPQQPVYARVDLVRRGSILLLMELELIDPMLFLTWVPESVQGFADLIVKRSR